MSLATRIKEAIEKSGLSKAEVARATGKSPAAVTLWLNGETRSIKGDTAAALEATTGYRAQWIVSGKGRKLVEEGVVEGPEVRGYVPLLSSVQAGAYKEFLTNMGDEMEKIPTTVPVNKCTFALRVKGDSMEPEFLEGVIVIVEPDLDPQAGDFVIVMNGDGEANLKQLVKDGGDWLLKPMNERYGIKPLGSNTIVGVVRGQTKHYR